MDKFCRIVAAIGLVFGCCLFAEAQQVLNLPSASAPPQRITLSGSDFIVPNSVTTIPANVTLTFEKGTRLRVTRPLNFLGKIDAGDYQIFVSDSVVTLNPATEALPEWFGAKADGVTDSGPAIQAAINAFSANGNPYGSDIGPSGGGWSSVKFGPGIYLYKTPLVSRKSGMHFHGRGVSATILRFQPQSSGLISLTFEASPADEIHDIGISELTMDATNSSNSRVKTALKMVDLREVNVNNLTIRDYSDATHASTCIDLHGREAYAFENINLACNLPLNIGADPNASNEGLDRSSFHNIIFGALTSAHEGSTCVTDKPVIQITEADAFLTNVSFEDFDFECGNYGVFWTATNSKTPGSNNVSFRHGRNEGAGTADWVFFHSPNVPTFGLHFEDISIQNAVKGGWYLRNVFNGSLNNVTYQTTASVSVIDADSSVSMSLTNANWNVHSSGVYTGLNGWCGVRYGHDVDGNNVSTGQMFLRSCGTPQIVFESAPGGATKTITAASCTGNALTFTIGAHSFGVGGQIAVTGVTPSGLNGTYQVSAVGATTLTVRSALCPLTYSSGGTDALTYGPLAYIGTNSVFGAQVAGDLALRSEGSQILTGFSGVPVFSITPNFLELFDTAGTAIKAYIAVNTPVMSGYTTNDLQFRSDGSNILFGFSGSAPVMIIKSDGNILFPGLACPAGKSAVLSIDDTGKITPGMCL